MGAQSFVTVSFGKTATEAHEKAYEHAENYYGHREGYSGQINAKRKGAVEIIDESDYKGRDRRKVMGEILHQDGDLSDEYPAIQRKTGPTGAISLKGTKEARQYRERNGLKGKHGDVWLLFGFART